MPLSPEARPEAAAPIRYRLTATGRAGATEAFLVQGCRTWDDVEVAVRARHQEGWHAVTIRDLDSERQRRIAARQAQALRTLCGSATAPIAMHGDEPDVYRQPPATLPAVPGA